jgi:hypothetical protein
MYQGELALASSLLKEGLIINWNIHDYRGTGACLAALAELSMMQGRIEEATKLFGVVESMIEFTRIPLLPFDHQEYERNLARLREELDEKTLNKFWAKGKQMSLEEAIAFALEEA